MAKTALITGVTGQDGAYLSQHLLSLGYNVFGGTRRSSSSSLNYWRLDELGITKDVRMVDLELFEIGNILRTIEAVKPDEIYNLAAQSFVAVSFEQPLYTGEIDAMGVTRLLESVRMVNSSIRFYQASTSEMFGKVAEVPQRETTPFYPRSPYAAAKLYAHWMVVNYRESWGLHASSGILFNHESPLRGAEFVTRKITSQLAEVKHGLRDRVRLGNIDAKRDWGYAADFVKGMQLMLQQEHGDNYILATGRSQTVRSFVEAAAKALGFDIEWRGEGENASGIDRKSGRTIVVVDPEFYRPAEVDYLLGEPGKAKERLSWEPKTTFEELVTMMAEADERRVRDRSVARV
jgi:GDPmannose 4,6-dehydratase